MKKISEKAVAEIVNILAGSSHPTLTFNQVNNTIIFLQKLEDVEEVVKEPEIIKKK